MRNCLGFVCLLVCLVWPSLAQTPATPNELAKLDFLLGEWQGEGWIEFGPGQRHTFHQTETIQRKAGGAVVLIEGLGLERRGNQDVPIHQAFGVVSFDQQTKRPHFRAWRADGGEVACEPELGERSFIWGFTEPRSGLQIKFTIKLNEAGQWVETGEGSPDGKTWRQFFEMKLQKITRK
jgi:hypothetical protein